MQIFIILEVIPDLWKFIGDQLFSIVLLVTMGYYLVGENNALKKRIDDLTKMIIESKEKDKEDLMEVIKGHNEALRRITDIFDKLIN